MAITYASLTDLKAQLGITDSSQNTYLTAILESVETNINTYLGYDPTETEIEEHMDTYGLNKIYMRRGGPGCPIVSVDEVYENTAAYYGQAVAFSADDLLEEGVDYVWIKDHIPNNTLLRLTKVWPYAWYRPPSALASALGAMPGCVKVNYTIDPTALLTVCAEAALLEGIARYRATLTGTGVVQSDSMDGASVGVAQWRRNPYNERPDSRDQFISPFVSSMLHPYRPATSFFVSY